MAGSSFAPSPQWPPTESRNPTPGFETAAIHGARLYNEGTGAVTAPIFATSTFASGNAGGFDYTRSGNPNFRHLEDTLCNLEQAKHATVFASGVAAITAVVSSLKSGDLILAEQNIYGCTFRLFARVFAKFGLQVAYLDFTNPENFAQIKTRKPRLVWLESPTNPLLKVIDIAAVAEVAHQSGAQVLVDNTFASSYVQQPLSLGADLSLSSTTKFTNGHSDCLGGAVCTNDPEWAEALVFAQKALGLNPAPFDAWLISRGIKTLAIRMRQHAQNALTVARFLEHHPLVSRVRYPFLPSHPQYHLAKQQMKNGSGVVTAELRLPLNETRRVLGSLKYFTLAESLGGVESLACHPASMTHAAIPQELRLAAGISDSLVRFSVGIEDEADLIADLDMALAKAGNHAQSHCFDTLAV